jgi:hypothetical protein
MGKYFTLTLYEKNLQNGELWIRTPNNTVLPAHEVLKNVFIKYKDVDPNITNEPGYQSFYEQLNTGQSYLRFDIIQDVIFVETSKGCILDQITYENGIVYPKTQDNNFITSLSSKRFGFPSYWFNEDEHKIYIASNSTVDWAGSNTWEDAESGIVLKYIIEEFDMETSILDVKCHFNLKLQFSVLDTYKELPIVEPVKLSYNEDTKTFNLSHICRGPKKQFGLISINLLNERNELKVKQVNALLPLQTDIKVPFIIPDDEPDIVEPIERVPSSSPDSFLTLKPTSLPPLPPKPIIVYSSLPQSVSNLKPTTNITIIPLPIKKG